MRGSIVKRPSKKDPRLHNYYVVYRIDGRQKWECVGPNKRDAERRLSEIVSQIHNGSYHKPKDIRFKDFAEIWLRDYAQGAVKDSTFRNYRNMLAQKITPIVGDLNLSDISTHRIQSLMAELLKGRNPNTVNKHLTMLKTLFKHARKWGYLVVSPAEDIQKYRCEQREMDILTPAEVQTFLKYADEPYKTLFLTAILTGLRRGELLGLQWGDIDWRSSVLRVRRSLFWLGKGEADAQGHKTRWKFVTPKSKRSVRNIVLSPILKDALEVHRLNSPTGPNDLIFTGKSGGPIDPDNMIHREFLPTLERAGLRKIRFHDLRHTYTTGLIAQGENVKFIQSQLGHASIQTTIDRYGHLLPLDAHGVGSRLDQQFFGPSGLEASSKDPVRLTA
jgi:integrase